MSDRYLLGVSAFYHDSAACLVRNGEIVAAAQEERFSRRKGDESIPSRAAAFCLRQGGIEASRLDAVAFYDKPLLKLDRLLETYLAIAPRGVRSFLHAAPLWSRQRLTLEGQLRAALGGYAGRVLFAEHHESHAASAFYPSPFPEAAVLTIDGVGEWATASIAHGEGHRLRVLRELHFPDSLGLLYSAFTYHAGFRVNSGEYKLMGLAPYGEPRYVDAIYRHLLSLRDEITAMGFGERARAVARQSLLLEEFLAREAAAGRLEALRGKLKPLGKPVLVHGHCHQKAFGAMPPVLQVLRLIPGVEPQAIESSCCGMAGSFGYEAKHHEVSMKMAELSLLPAVRAAPDAIVVADGTSCRHQIHDGARRQAVHAAVVLHMALRA